MEYEILEEYEKDGFLYSKIRTVSGVTVTCKIPLESENTKEMLGEIGRFVCPECDIAGVKRIDIIT